MKRAIVASALIALAAAPLAAGVKGSVAGAYVDREVKCVNEDGRIVIIAVQGGTKSEFNAGLVLRRRITITGSTLRPRPVAYFSAEFGLHESIPVYSGGLGVLAGDHIKSASDLDIPLIGIGLFRSGDECSRHRSQGKD